MGILCKISARKLCPWGPWRPVEAGFLDGDQEHVVFLKRRICRRCGKSEETEPQQTTIRALAS